MDHYLVSVEKQSILFEFKADENFNWRNTLSILKLKIFIQRRNRVKEAVFLQELNNDVRLTIIMRTPAPMDRVRLFQGR